MTIRFNKRDFSLEELQKIISESIDKVEFAKKLGFHYSNGQIYKKIDDLISQYNLSEDHFDSSAKVKARRKYPIIKKNCPICNTEFKTSIGNSEERVTCSYSCSNKYFASIRHTDLSKDKVSKSLKTYYGTSDRASQICCFCNAPFHNRNIVKYCSKKCRLEDPELRKRLSDLVMARIANGTHKGWASRLKVKPSFPEQYVIKLLDELQISYQREYKAGRWFIDFADIDRKIALEIDGAQHNIPERKASDEKKDQYLIDNNWKVFRIKWKKVNKEVREQLISKLKEIFIISRYDSQE